jgi:histidine triad (HIT) family protein
VADCVFCRIAAVSIPSTIVYQDDSVVAFEDLNPGAPVHVLVIPREHFTDVRDVRDPALLRRMFEVAERVAVDKGVGESGYRLVFNVGPDAGQSVFHAHLHLLGGRSMAWPPG